MSSSRGNAAQVNSVIAPRDICESCKSYTGPKFVLSGLRDASGLLRKNIILSESELISATSNITHAENEIQRLDAEVTRLQRSLDALTHHRSQLDKFVLRERALFSPIRKLPAEVLQKIFYHAQELTKSDFRTAFVRVATQVSAFWRMTAHSCMELWTNVQVALPHSAKELKRAALGPFIEKCISLSKNAPLTICLRGQCNVAVLGDNCLRALAENARRWENIAFTNWRLQQSVYVRVSKGVKFTRLSDLTIGGVIDSRIHLKSSPMLRSITLDYVSGVNSHIEVQSAPSLTRLDLGNVQNPIVVFINLPWSQITDLTSRKNIYARDELYDILQNMPDLRILRFDGNTNANRPIVLRHLEVLQLDGLEINNILDILISPSLKELVIGRNFISRTVVAFLRRSQCTLEKLILNSTIIDETWCADEFGAVKELRMNSQRSITTLLKALKSLAVLHSGSGWTLFPRLEVLHVEGIEVGLAEETIVKALIDMIRSRMPVEVRVELLPPGWVIDDTTATLKIVNLSFKDLAVEDMPDTLKKFLFSDVVRKSTVEICIRDSRGALILSTL